MPVILIREQPGFAGKAGFGATVSFDGQGEFPCAIQSPFSAEEERRLEWYFEQHLRFPFVDQVKASEAADSVDRYGEDLFKQVFHDPEAFARYREECQYGMDTLRIEVAGSPEFHQIHWEALRDARLPQPLALQVPIVRKNQQPQTLRAVSQPTPVVNLLLVTARPSGKKDVAGEGLLLRPFGTRKTNTACPSSFAPCPD